MSDLVLVYVNADGQPVGVELLARPGTLSSDKVTPLFAAFPDLKEVLAPMLSEGRPVT